MKNHELRFFSVFSYLFLYFFQEWYHLRNENRSSRKIFGGSQIPAWSYLKEYKQLLKWDPSGCQSSIHLEAVLHQSFLGWSIFSGLYIIEFPPPPCGERKNQRVWRWGRKLKGGKKETKRKFGENFWQYQIIQTD